MESGRERAGLARLAVSWILLGSGVVLGQGVASSPEGPPWAVELGRALRLNARGEHSQAVEALRTLLASPLLAAPGELRAYVLSQLADCEIELGAYAGAEREARESLRILTASGKTGTPEVAISEGVLSRAL